MIVTDLPNECLLSIMSYLSKMDLTAVSVAKRIFRDLPMVNFIWVQHCFSKWKMNFACNKILAKADFRLLYPLSWPATSGLLSRDDEITIINETDAFFNGVVGNGNRSVQTTNAFPTTRPTVTELSLRDFMYMLISKTWRKRNEMLNRPFLFSTPFYDEFNYENPVVQPRSIAYYEVLVTRLDTSESSSLLPFLANETSADCIAVGLASEDFRLDKRLPGWDSQSFGYHSDDGAIFHGGGRAVAAYGPKFGDGDVIGCGINYLNGSIFFTLNGTSLGTAFCDIAPGLRLHPTVGVDANVQLSFNFGLQPFKYPLSLYIGT
mmetsp:Transcript_15743/g.15880  ORF Transcript_15743/g.15880 Transcript_15743/m.15880 type:complete len:320 (-) Transcript_15743:142-1101(-)|eukprot:CAMPEP_0182433306 /NCGR_PEP_ID=MMETSP1167-20130531/62392_1 /TAXON_ID=2988 /ORGANISM="Mallomonas Sp, Strain CCMP3275" /LENGTH=319 /DNA_ID=CAMNT_0024621845 /DNA_START=42 /DNA_END=1001 /DNA_ORIENTATION=-